MTLFARAELRYRKGREPSANATVFFMFLRLVVFVSAAAWTIHAAGPESGLALVVGATMTRAILTRSGGRRGAGST